MEIQEERQSSRRNREMGKDKEGRKKEGTRGCVATRATAESQYDSPLRVGRREIKRASEK